MHTATEEEDEDEATSDEEAKEFATRRKKRPVEREREGRYLTGRRGRPYRGRWDDWLALEPVSLAPFSPPRGCEPFVDVPVSGRLVLVVIDLYM